MILVDTSVLIDYFRKQNKEKVILFELFSQKEDLAISVITKYELMIGSNKLQDSFWNTLLDSIKIFSLDEAIVDETILIKKELKVKNNEIGLADMIIAATARFNKIKLITLNYNHFKKVTNLKVY
jgi:tRNA(fMet)-specific endonuclease VapC